MSSGDDDFRWNVFRSHKRATTEKPSLTPWMITSLQATKLLLFLVCNTFLTLGAAISKICILILATNLWEKRYTSDPYARRCTRVPVERTPRAVAAMYLGLMLIQTAPDVVSVIRSLMRLYRGDKAGRVRFSFVTLETLRAFGLSLLVFTVFPQLDLYRFLSTTTLPHLILFLGLFSATYLWNVMETPFQVKYGLRKLNVSTRLVIAMVRIVVVVTIMSYAAQGRVKPYLFLNVLTSYSFRFKQTQLLLAAFGIIFLNMSLRGCARFLAAIGMKVFSILHPVTIVPAVGYAIVAFICNQRICGIAGFLAKLGLRWCCDQWGRNTRPFDDWYICMIWLAVGAYRGYQFVHQKSYDSCDEEPTLDIDDDHGDPLDELRVRNDEVDKTLTLYMCATMWHETATEMAQMLRSILKLDEEHAHRLSTKKVDQLRFRLEGHIFFDDAWEDQTEFGITKRVPNDFFHTFFDTLSELTG
ncbi:hypothetical protein ANCDUO_10679 [Ancylostoma duodenale]|uniref:Chitin synthase chs-1/2 N-terminal putative transporter domain-containing protein n=1 Tax=Ancylostoma duodenale TaxID=51022 RepID=A0A0C2CQP9_9BILA|nr:hypothetical protein ANCDUO_10679 [Ancylostoma duodenale]